jgi:hypothetical protein
MTGSTRPQVIDGHEPAKLDERCYYLLADSERVYTLMAELSMVYFLGLREGKETKS